MHFLAQRFSPLFSGCVFQSLFLLVHYFHVLQIQRPLLRLTFDQVAANNVECTVHCADLSAVDSGNYTCEVRGPQSVVLGRVTHYVYVQSKPVAVLSRLSSR